MDTGLINDSPSHWKPHWKIGKIGYKEIHIVYFFKLNGEAYNHTLDTLHSSKLGFINDDSVLDFDISEKDGLYEAFTLLSCILVE